MLKKRSYSIISILILIIFFELSQLISCKEVRSTDAGTDLSFDTITDDNDIKSDLSEIEDAKIDTNEIEDIIIDTLNDISSDNENNDTNNSEPPLISNNNHNEGYRRADCFSCHEKKECSQSSANDREPDCAGCHGPNGAPQYYHLAPNCYRCHSNSHADLDFEQPDDCAICHDWSN